MHEQTGLSFFFFLPLDFRTVFYMLILVLVGVVPCVSILALAV